MLDAYEKFLEEFDKKLESYFKSQKNYIKCEKGCSKCCEIGEYPFSRLEAEYIMRAFIRLPKETKDKIRANIEGLKKDKMASKAQRFLYKCPFLIDNLCALYKYRGIVCRTHGLAYLDDLTNKIKLPECARIGLNYSGVFNQKDDSIYIVNPIKENFKIDYILRSDTAQRYKLECGAIRPLIDWFL